MIDKITSISSGDEVGWEWGTGLATGIVEEVRYKRTELESKGKKIVRKGSKDNPALIISHGSGTPVLKLESEVKKIA